MVEERALRQAKAKAKRDQVIAEWEKTSSIPQSDEVSFSKM